MIEKTWDYWAVFAGMAIYILVRDRQTETLALRISKTVASALIAVAISSDVADYLGVSEKISAIVILGFGVIALDLVTGLARDREFIKSILKNRLGGKDGE